MLLLNGQNGRYILRSTLKITVFGGYFQTILRIPVNFLIAIFFSKWNCNPQVIL
jgi:hypothetical protein